MLTKDERLRGMANTKSRRTAIQLMCRDCIYDSDERGSARQQIHDCPSLDCPLWNFRPQHKHTPNTQETANKPARFVSNVRTVLA